MSYRDGLVGRAERGEAAGKEAPAEILKDELEAIRRCQEGDEDAFRIVVEGYGSLLYGTAYLMLRDRGQAEDAVQDAFLSAWRGINKFSTERPLRPWLLRIVVNVVLQRKRRKLLHIVSLPDAERAATPEPGPEALAEQSWERDEMRIALSKLPGDASRILILRFFAELSLAELAEVLQVPEGTVKSRLHRALQKLHKVLTRRDFTPQNNDENQKRFQE